MKHRALFLLMLIVDVAATRETQDGDVSSNWMRRIKLCSLLTTAGIPRPYQSVSKASPSSKCNPLFLISAPPGD